VKVRARWRAGSAVRRSWVTLGSDTVGSGERRPWTAAQPLYHAQGQINALHVSTSRPDVQRGRVDPAYWRKIVLRIAFDDHDIITTPDIEAPLSDLFGDPFAEPGAMAANLFLGKDLNGQGASLALPMPFRSGVNISVENGNDFPISIEISADSTGGDFQVGTNAGYLHARYMEEITQAGVPNSWLNISGDRGHYVGVVQAMTWSNPPNSLGFLEGDDKFWVDSQVPPGGAGAIDSRLNAPFNGTGTEDYFNSAYYFSGGVHIYPLHGLTHKREDNPGSTYASIGAFRFHFLDSPSFTNGIVAEIEHGGQNDAPGAYYASTVFWYSAGPAQPRERTMPSAALIPILERQFAVPRNP
jgi:hypothetical protein